MQDTQLLNELRPIILSGIKNRAKTIEEKFETLLINIQNKSHQLKQSQRIRFEYFQFLYIRFNEEMEREKTMEYLYDRIEKMQYDLHQEIHIKQFQIKPIDNNENFYFQQIIFIKNEITINNHKKLLRLIKKIESFIE
ncbi:unnamed protein product, partial [Rotaria sp. Silwood1]